MSGSCYCDVCLNHESVCACHDTCLERIAKLEATIERVRALPAEWKRDASPEDREGLEMAADDLLAELTPTTEGSDV